MNSVGSGATEWKSGSTMWAWLGLGDISTGRYFAIKKDGTIPVNPADCMESSYSAGSS